ncbi:MAG: hypothetical protein ACOCRK_02130 [bacterium]
MIAINCFMVISIKRIMRKILFGIITVMGYILAAVIFLTIVVNINSGLLDFGPEMVGVGYPYVNILYKTAACFMNICNQLSVVILIVSEVYIAMKINQILYDKKGIYSENILIKFINLLSLNIPKVRYFVNNVCLICFTGTAIFTVGLSGSLILLIYGLSYIPALDFMFKAFVPLVVLPVFIILTIVSTITNIIVMVLMGHFILLQREIFSKIEDKEIKNKMIKGSFKMIVTFLGIVILSIGIVAMLWIGMFSSFVMFLKSVLGDFALVIYTVANCISGITFTIAQVIYSIFIVYSFGEMVNYEKVFSNLVEKTKGFMMKSVSVRKKKAINRAEAEREEKLKKEAQENESKPEENTIIE